MAEKKKYTLVVLGNPVPGKEKECNYWYAYQHFWDLLRVDGYKSAQLFKMAPAGEQLEARDRDYTLMSMWDIETDDIEALNKEINRRIEDKETVFDGNYGPVWYDYTLIPLTKKVTKEECIGKTRDEIVEISGLTEKP